MSVGEICRVPSVSTGADMLSNLSGNEEIIRGIRVRRKTAFYHQVENSCPAVCQKKECISSQQRERKGTNTHTHTPHGHTHTHELASDYSSTQSLLCSSVIIRTCQTRQACQHFRFGCHSSWCHGEFRFRRVKHALLTRI